MASLSLRKLFAEEQQRALFHNADAIKVRVKASEGGCCENLVSEIVCFECDSPHAATAVPSGRRNVSGTSAVRNIFS